MKLIDKDALVAEIERICAEEKALFDEQCRGEDEPSPSPAVVCMKMECLLSFINTLEVKEMKEEPASEDLEDAVNAYIGHKPDVDECSSVYGKRQAFKAGAHWQEEQFEKK